MTHAAITPIRVSANQLPIIVMPWEEEGDETIFDYISWLEANEHVKQDLEVLPSSIRTNV